MTMRRPLRPTVLVAVPLLAAACGSTVAGVGTSTPAGTAGLTAPTAPGASTAGSNGLSLPPGSTAGAAGQPVAGGRQAGQVAVGSAGSVGGHAPGATAGGGTGGAHGVTVNAPGVTDSTIYIGIGYSPDAGSGDAALGAANAAPSYDARNVTNAAFDYANAHGGFAGRKLKAVFFRYNLTDDRTTQDQAACANYTQDNKVFAIMADTDVLRACAEKAHAIPYGVGSATAATFRQFPHYFDPAGIRFDRLGQVTVNGLATQHYFTGRLGLMTWDDPHYRAAVNDGYLPALAAHHVKLATDPVYITVPQAVGALSDMSAAVSSAVTKFKTMGIDHVIIQDGPAGVFKGDGLTFEFMNNAKSQKYYPKYGGNTYSDPGSSIYPSDEEDHMLAVSDVDLSADNDAGWHLNQARETCFKIQAAAGYPPKSGNANDEAEAALSCDTAFFLQRVINSLSVISPDAFIRAVDHMGTSFASALVFQTNLFPGRHDGSDAVRVVEYLASCNCLKYKGPPYNVG